MIEGLSHITLVVQDLERTACLLKTVFEAQEVYSSGERYYSKSQEKFFVIGGVWLATMQGVPSNRMNYEHIAFKIKDNEYDDYIKKISSLDIDLEQPRSRHKGEGRSIYFFDYDYHLFELHTGTLEERLSHYSDLAPLP